MQGEGGSRMEMEIDAGSSAAPERAGATGHGAAAIPRPRGDHLHAVREASDAWHERMLDLRSAAGMLGITPTTLRRWLLAGRGPKPFRDGDGPGGRVRFDIREIRGYLTDPTAYEAAKPGNP